MTTMATSSSAKKKTPANKVSVKEKFSGYKTFKPSFKQTVSGLLIFSIVLFGISGWFWWRSIATDPDRVLNDMLSRSLQTGSTTRVVTQKNRQTLLDQKVRMDFTPSPTAQTITALSQQERDSTSVVTTETLGTKNDDFIRYRTIESPESNFNQESLKDIVNIWSKRESGGEPPTFLNEALLTLVPFGNLNKEDRQTVLDIIKSKKVYTYTKAVQERQKGRLVMVYDMDIAPEGLVEALATQSKLSGFGDQPQLDPKSYAGIPAVKVRMTVDILSRQLTSIEYSDSDRKEAYQASGLRSNAVLPTQTIGLSELQKRLQNLQQPEQ